VTAPLARSPDVLLVSLGSTAGLREADAELAASLERAGARVAVARAGVPRPVRTLALTDLTWAVAARRAAAAALRELAPRAVLYSSTTAALLGPAAGAVRFDAPAAGNRPGRHGIWQRPAEARRLARSPRTWGCASCSAAARRWTRRSPPSSRWRTTPASTPATAPSRPPTGRSSSTPP
jgi:hypothetical protein